MWTTCVFLALPTLLSSASNVDSLKPYAWGENVGWVNFQGDGTNGVVVKNTVLSGYAWCESSGWLCLGNGTPAGGATYYSNSSATDFGVNNNGGSLSGYGWGENIGWVSFDTSAQGGSRVTIDGTGQFHGYAWGENVGWINLDCGAGVRAVIDTTPPTGAIVINNNRSATNNPNVTLTLTWTDGAGSGVSRMRFSDDGSHWTAWEALTATTAHVLPTGDDHKTVRVQYIDKANNKSAVFSDYILLDTTPPTGSIIINDGALTTTKQAVTLKLAWSDTGAGVTRMRFSDNGSTWSYWMLPTATRAYSLPAGNGYHTVRVQYLDGANNYSAVYNDYIKLQLPGGKSSGATEASFSLAYSGSNPIVAGNKSDATLSVVPQHANGAVSYQWYRKSCGAPEQLFGNTDATLKLKDITAPSAGQYYCEGSDDTATVNSETVTVQVAAPVPMLGGLGLVALAILAALGGAVTLRRSKPGLHRRP